MTEVSKEAIYALTKTLNFCNSDLDPYAVLDDLANQGFTITRSPQMTEFDLKLEAERLAYGAMVDGDRMQLIINLAKKYRGEL